MKLLKILIVFVLILLPFGELLRFDVGNNIVLKPIDIVVGITALWCLMLQLASRSLPQSNLVKPVLAFIAIGFISLLINSWWLEQHEFFASLLYLLRWASYAGIFFALIKFEDNFKKKLTMFLLVDGLIMLLLGYLQYFFFSNLKILYHLGWDDHMYRMFSVFFDPNFAGAFFVLYFIFIGGLLYKIIIKHTAKITFLKSYAISKKTAVISLTVLLLLTLLAVFLTFSRAALLMLLIGASTFFFLIHRKKLIFVILAAIILYGIASSSQFYIENRNLFRSASIVARLSNYSTALTIIQDNPLIGVGFNSYRYAKDRYGFPSGWTKAPSHADAGVDNSFLFVLATTGIWGIIAYLWLWFAILKKAYAIHKSKANIFATIVIASSVGLCVNALFINSLFFPALLLWMWILIGLLFTQP